MLKPEDRFDIPYSENDTDVLGNVGAFMRYYRRGTAFEEWQNRIQYIEEEFDAHAFYNSSSWSHIILYQNRAISITKEKQEPAIPERRRLRIPTFVYRVLKFLRITSSI